MTLVWQTRHKGGVHVSFTSSSQNFYICFIANQPIALTPKTEIFAQSSGGTTQANTLANILQTVNLVCGLSENNTACYGNGTATATLQNGTDEANLKQ